MPNSATESTESTEAQNERPGFGPAPAKQLEDGWLSKVVRRRFGWIGIDIAESEIRVAQVAWSPHSGFQLARTAHVDFDGVLAGEEPILPPEFKRTCRRFRGRRVVASLPWATQEFRTAPVPDMPDHELRMMLGQDVADDRPVPFVYDFWKIRGSGRNNSRHLAMLISDEEPAARLGEELYKLGMDCEGIDGQPLALARTAPLAGADPDQPVAVVQFGESESLFCLAHRSENVYTREMKSCHLRGLSEVLGDGLGLSVSDAKSILMRLGLAVSDAPGQEMRAAMRGMLRRTLAGFTDEIQQTIGFTRSFGRDLVPQQIIFAGVGANIPGLHEYFGEDFDIPICNWNMLAGSPVEGVSAFATAAGLSLLGISRNVV